MTGRMGAMSAAATTIRLKTIIANEVNQDKFDFNEITRKTSEYDSRSSCVLKLV